MSEYRLQSHEVMLMKSTHVGHGFWGAFTDEIMLTNLSFIWTSIGMLGFPKKTYRYPLSQVKMHNGKYQVFQGKHGGNGSSVLEIYLMNGSVEQFKFQTSEKESVKEIQKWIRAFNGTIEGNDDEDEDESGPEESVLGVLKELGGGLLESFGFQTKQQSRPQKKPSKEYSVKECSGCGATISGVKGKIVRCQYCGSDQLL